MTIAACIRVVLAILALVLVPLWAPAQPAVAMTAPAMPMTMAEAGADCVHHACDHGGAPLTHHADAACALGCLQASLPSLLLSAPPGVRPLAAPSRLVPPVVASLPSRHPSPPERPPRV